MTLTSDTMSRPWDATTEYRSCFVHRGKPCDDPDVSYERIVSRMIRAGATQRTEDAGAAIPPDPYEAIVRRKMESHGENEPPPVDNSAQAAPKPDREAPVDDGAPDDAGSWADAPPPRTRRARLAPKRSFRAPRQTFAKAQDRGALQFFRDPGHATAQEAKHLYGPFFVAWPKGSPMPSSYADLARIYGRRVQ